MTSAPATSSVCRKPYRSARRLRWRSLIGLPLTRCHQGEYVAWRQRVTMLQDIETKVADVRIEGLQRINPEYLRSVATVEPGDAVDIEALSDDATAHGRARGPGFGRLPPRGRPDQSHARVVAQGGFDRPERPAPEPGHVCGGRRRPEVPARRPARASLGERSGCAVAQQFPGRLRDPVRDELLPAFRRRPALLRRAGLSSPCARPRMSSSTAIESPPTASSMSADGSISA